MGVAQGTVRVVARAGRGTRALSSRQLTSSLDGRLNKFNLVFGVANRPVTTGLADNVKLLQ